MNADELPDADELRIGVVGAGATGGLLAAALSAAGTHVTLVARGRSAEVIGRDGLRVTDPQGRTRVHRPARLVGPGEPVEPPVDVALVCVKSYDVETVAPRLGPLIGPHGCLLSLQNGVLAEDVLATHYGADRVLAGVLYVGAQRPEPGVVVQHTDARIVLGPYRGEATRPVWEPLAATLRRAGIAATVDTHVRAAAWEKFLFNCGLNPLTALTGHRLGAVLARDAGRDLFDGLVDEALAAARADGAELPADVLERVHATAARMDISSSMAEDLAAGRRLELDAFSGHVLALADRHRLSTPVTAVVDRLLRLHEGLASAATDRT